MIARAIVEELTAAIVEFEALAAALEAAPRRTDGSLPEAAPAVRVLQGHDCVSGILAPDRGKHGLDTHECDPEDLFRCKFRSPPS